MANSVDRSTLFAYAILLDIWCTKFEDIYHMNLPVSAYVGMHAISELQIKRVLKTFFFFFFFFYFCTKLFLVGTDYNQMRRFQHVPIKYILVQRQQNYPEVSPL